MENKPQLDGFRGLALLIVIASHTNGLGLYGMGGFGVWMFYCLSAYLLTSKLPKKFNFRFVIDFQKRRLKRIIPLYFIFIVVYSILWKLDITTIIRHFTFLEAKSHLWSVQQELLFYCILPIVFYGLLKKLGPLSIIIFAYLYHLFFEQLIVLGSPDEPVIFYFSTFILGCACAIFLVNLKQTVNKYISFLITLLFIVFVFTVSINNRTSLSSLLGTDLFIDQGNLSWKYPFELSILCSAMLINVFLAKDRLTKAIFENKMLMQVGKLSYCMYLVHPAFILLLHNYPSLNNFFVITALSFVAGKLSYKFIEKPILSGK